MANNTNTDLRNQVIYCIYVRNHTNEGTFKAIEDDLKRIKELGTDIIWFMPIHPIGEKNKKGNLGCPYAIKDYRAVNPEYGSLEDFEGLVEKIHSLGMKCIIDVVYNHTSPDSWLAENHPEFFYRKADGKMGNRVGDWTDIVDLDYSCKELWNYQIETLKQWAKIVDGFRCDVASLVPVEFWQRARKECSSIKEKLIWLAESVHLVFLQDFRFRGFDAWSDGELYSAFDITYDYDIWDIYEKYLKGEMKLSEYLGYLNFQDAIYPNNYVKLRFLENHDQLRFKNYVSDMSALESFTAFLYFQKGTTLIYAGQEFANTHTPSLFDLDKIDRSGTVDLSGLMKKLYETKQNEIFSNGSYYLTANNSYDTVIGYYRKGEKTCVGIFPLKGKEGKVEVNIPDGVYHNELNNEAIVVKGNYVITNGKPIIIMN
ncbi:MAG: alpha-amylase family glycosyl hydrolase [Clostridia bacterium]|nr:alpha-amylase family glycosyl hydrolase [Clostridia bacterium]